MKEMIRKSLELPTSIENFIYKEELRILSERIKIFHWFFCLEKFVQDLYFSNIFLLNKKIFQISSLLGEKKKCTLLCMNWCYQYERIFEKDLTLWAVYPHSKSPNGYLMWIYNNPKIYAERSMWRFFRNLCNLYILFTRSLIVSSEISFGLKNLRNKNGDYSYENATNCMRRDSRALKEEISSEICSIPFWDIPPCLEKRM